MEKKTKKLTNKEINQILNRRNNLLKKIDYIDEKIESIDVATKNGTMDKYEAAFERRELHKQKKQLKEELDELPNTNLKYVSKKRSLVQPSVAKAVKKLKRSKKFKKDLMEDITKKRLENKPVMSAAQIGRMGQRYRELIPADMKKERDKAMCRRPNPDGKYHYNTNYECVPIDFKNVSEEDEEIDFNEYIDEFDEFEDEAMDINEYIDDLEGEPMILYEGINPEEEHSPLRHLPYSSESESEEQSQINPLIQPKLEDFNNLRHRLGLPPLTQQELEELEANFQAKQEIVEDIIEDIQEERYNRGLPQLTEPEQQEIVEDLIENIQEERYNRGLRLLTQPEKQEIVEDLREMPYIRLPPLRQSEIDNWLPALNSQIVPYRQQIKDIKDIVEYIQEKRHDKGLPLLTQTQQQEIVEDLEEIQYSEEEETISEEELEHSPLRYLPKEEELEHSPLRYLPEEEEESEEEESEEEKSEYEYLQYQSGSEEEENWNIHH